MTTPSKDAAPARNATRAPIDRPVRLQFEGESEVVEVRSKNVSIGGMFILGAPDRERGHQVKFELVLDESVSVRGLAEVAWAQSSGGGSREAGLGLKFRFLEQRDRQQIFKLVSQHIKERLAKEGTHGQAPSSLFESSSPAAAPGIAIPPSPEGPGPVVPPAPASPPATAAVPPDPAPLPAPPPAAEKPDESDESWAGSPSGGGLVVSDDVLGGEVSDPWTAPPPSKPKKGPGLMKLLVPIVLLLGVAVGWYFVLGPGASPSSGAPEADVSVAADADLPQDSVAESPVGASSPSMAQPGDPSTPDASMAGGDVSGSAVPPPSAPAPREIAPPPAPTVRSGQAGPAFGRLVDLRWRTEGADLVLTLETDGTVGAGRYKYFRIGGESAREVVRLLGVSDGYSGPAPLPDVPAISRVRFGYHEKPEGNELHIVLDLADASWMVVEVVPVGNRLEARLSRS